MKKILNLLTISILSSSSISSVIGCDNINKNPYNSVTKDQEIYALNNFIQKNKNKLDPGFKFYDLSDNTDSIFNNHKEKSNIQIIDWTVNSSQNSRKDNFTILKASYNGIMTYNLRNKTFILNDNPFLQPTYIPGNFNPGLGVQSMISGNTNDFTIAANSGKLADFVDLIAPGGFAKGIGDVFKNMEWHNSKNFPKLTLNILKSIYLKYDFWYVPTGYMAIINVIKIHNQFQVVWSNLNNEQEKKSLVDSGAGYLTNTFWKETNIENHLWISKSLLTMIYQLKTNNLNQFLNNSASFFCWLNPIESISDIDRNGYKPGIQIAKNTNQTELWDGINNLLTNWNINQNIIKGLLIAKPILPHNWQEKNKDYQAYDLVFKKNNNKWTFSDESKGMEEAI